MIPTTYWGGWLELGGRRWWLCEDDEGFACLYPEDEEGPPGIRMACDTEEELLELAVEGGVQAGLLRTTTYDI